MLVPLRCFLLWRAIVLNYYFLYLLLSSLSSNLLCKFLVISFHFSSLLVSWYVFSLFLSLSLLYRKRAILFNFLFLQFKHLCYYVLRNVSFLLTCKFFRLKKCGRVRVRNPLEKYKNYHVNFETVKLVRGTYWDPG